MLSVTTSQIDDLTTMLTFPRLLKESVTSSYVVWGGPFARRVGVAQIFALCVRGASPVNDEVAVTSYPTERFHRLR